MWWGLAVAVHAMPTLQQYVHLHVMGHIHDGNGSVYADAHIQSHSIMHMAQAHANLQ